ncbi:ADP-ribosylglycohydrolase [Hamadaea flava]|uniref:ADP-ribosylglycohydrolase family protein n=1 Tax=Hamadaea flava TaxID=1742688 RepID=A0ABV8LM43_9ACTN|nr:ADP-ribosylglycohydrolase family protein [Hamadaea flava]MCP2323812.1 ADP-ribosylglycohydrolase [Hamadaea flava]
MTAYDDAVFRPAALERAALDSLQGLALGDAFGQTWFRPEGDVTAMLAQRRPQRGPWPWTDDTAMAIVLLRLLLDKGQVDQDELAQRFASSYQSDPYRQYGPSMHGVLREIFEGESWAEVTGRQFDGMGSWGNGAAMRVAPLGAWFAQDMTLVVEQATLSAQVTHAHPEAVAGAVAVAVAAALAVRGVSGPSLLKSVLARTPDGEVAARLRRIEDAPFSLHPQWIASTVGSGWQVSAPDTVPFAIWCAARHLDDLADALWATISAGGDVDTTCAIVGGIVGARTGLSGVPAELLAAREPLPEWAGRVG